MKYAVLLILFFIVSCARPAFKDKWVKEKAPAHFIARFETSKGNFDAAFTREWSPLAVDRLYSQIRHRFYDHTLFYRVRPNFVAQFGADDSVKLKGWNRYKLADEPVIKPNIRAAISFARGGKETRGSDIFINIKSNSPRLDTINVSGVKGYPVMGMVTSNMTVVDSLYNGYGDTVFGKYDTLLSNKPVFLEFFPKVDSIKRIFLIRGRGSKKKK